MKLSIFLNKQVNIQVSRRTTPLTSISLFRNAQPSSIINPGWDRDFEFLGFLFTAYSPTSFTLFLNYLSFPVTSWAHRYLSETAKGSPSSAAHLTTTTTGGACARSRSWLSACTAT